MTKMLHCIFFHHLLRRHHNYHCRSCADSACPNLRSRVRSPSWYKWGKVWHSHSVPLLVQMRQSVTLTLSPVVDTNEAKCDTHIHFRCWCKWGKVWHSHPVPLLVQMRQSVTLTLSPVVSTNEAKCGTHTQSRCWYKWGKVWHSHSLPCLWWYCSSFFSPCYNRTSWLGVKHQVNSCVSWDERLGHLELLPLSESLGAGRARWG